MSTAAAYPSRAYAWYTVVLLTVAYILSFVDRYVLGLLVEPIKADLGLTDTQIGILIGPAFGVFYATMGLPLGLLADRSRRTWLLAAGITLWSLATAASGLAKNFWHLLTARMSVGVGEATLSPCAMSMISDSFPPEERGKPIAFYTAALSVGAGIASLTSAAVLEWAKLAPPVSLPVVGELATWQLIFFIVGLPGVLVALMFLTLREPPRLLVEEADAEVRATPLDMLRYVFGRFSVFGGLIAMVSIMTIVAYSQGWLPAMFARTWDFPVERYVLINGIMLLALGPLTVNIAGILCDRLTQRGVADAPLLIVMAGVLVLVPTHVLAPLMPGPYVAFVVLAVNTVGIALASSTGVTALLQVTPARIRGQTVALYYMCISLAGLFLGPLTVGLLTDYYFGEANLRYGVAAIAVLYGVPVIALMPFARRAYNREYRRFHGEA